MLKDAGAKGDRTKMSRACVVRAIVFDPEPQGPAGKPKANTGSGAAASSGTTEASRQAANVAAAQAPPAAARPGGLWGENQPWWEAKADASIAKSKAMLLAPTYVGGSRPAVPAFTDESAEKGEPVIPSTPAPIAAVKAQLRAGVKPEDVVWPAP